MVCPVCTIAVAAGIGVLEAWGVNPILIGIWFGALIVSSIMWMIDYLNRKKIHFLFRKILIIICFYAIFIIPLYYIKMGGKVVMSNALLLGVIVGTFVFILSVLAHNHLKKVNEGKVMMFWQKVIVPLVFLIVASIIAHFVILISSV